MSSNYELRTKAEMGDPDSQFDLGQAYLYGKDGYEKDVKKAIRWLKKAGVTHPAAYYVMIGIGLGAIDKGNKDANLVIECFRNLVGIHKSTTAMVLLGATLCGDPQNRHIRDILPELANPPYYNPKEGFQLIEEGIRLAESAAENPLGFKHYDDAFKAYHFQTCKVHNKQKRGEPYLPEGGIDNALAKEFECAKKALAALKAGKGADNVREKDVGQLIALYEDMVRKM